MIEGKLKKARAEAEKTTEQFLRVLKNMLIETYIEGFIKGMESCEENEDVLEQRLIEEEKALVGCEHYVSIEPIVKLKPDAILKRRLRKDDFNTRVWKTLVFLNIETLGDILQVSEKFYLSQRGFGKGCLCVLRDYVKQFGYNLKEI